MKEIPLTNGPVALVDDEDYERVTAFNWCAMTTRTGHTYAHRSTWDGSRVRTILMHRFILGAPRHKQVDHFNGRGLDNRRENLRLASRSENQLNRQGANRNSKTGLRNVSPAGGSFHVSLQVQGKLLRFGTWATIAEAERVAVLARRVHIENDHAAQSELAALLPMKRRRGRPAKRTLGSWCEEMGVSLPGKQQEPTGAAA